MDNSSRRSAASGTGSRTAARDTGNCVNSPLFRALFLPLLVVGGLATVIVAGAVSLALDHAMDRRFQERLEAEALVLGAALGMAREPLSEGVDELPAGARITLLDAGGRAVFDSSVDTATLGNLATRPEILRSISHGSGAARRSDVRAGETMLFAARAVFRDGTRVGFARIGYPNSLLEEQADDPRRQILGVACAALLSLIALAGWIIWRHCEAVQDVVEVSAQLSGGEFHNRLPIDRDDELGVLSRQLNLFAEHSSGQVEVEQQTSRRLAAILAGLNEGVVAIDDEQRVVHLNNAAQQMLREVEGDSLGQPVWEVVRISEIIEAVDDACSRQIASSMQIDIMARRYEVSVLALRNGDLEGVGAIVVFQDVTDLLHLEQVRTEFVANASHELKTPIAAIRGFVETIIDDPEMPADVQDRFLQRMRVQAARIENLVQELIALSRYDAARQELPLAPVDFSYVVRQAFQNKEEDASDASVTLHYEAPSRPLEVQGETEALAQLVMNLIDNGIKYVDAGGRVDVRLFNVGRHAVLEVEDNGIGIAQEERERIFERFYRVDKARSAEKGGTGLGLAIVKHIVHAHEGSLTLDSVLGKGSLFTVRLPLVGESNGSKK